jgi:rhamnosyltransferase
MKRLAVFLIYDRDGIVDEYIYFLLEKMQSAYSELVIVCNCSLQPGYKEKLHVFSNEIYERENKGFDAGAFKDALNDYIGWDRVRTFDELLLFNDSFFGPFFPITEVFDRMDRKKIDFWSMTKVNGNYKYASAIQSYFIVIKSSLLHSPCFEEYWMELPYYTGFDDVVHEYEMKFAEYFEKRGFIWDAYIDSDRYSIAGKSQDMVSLYHTVPNEIIEDQHYPFLKRKLFDLNATEKIYGLDKQTHENLKKTLDYIENHTGYNMAYIWDNVLRTYSLRNIQDCCCSINFIKPSGIKKINNRVKALVWLWEQPSTYKNIHRIFNQLEQDNVVIGTNNNKLFNFISENYRDCGIVECQSPNLFWKKLLSDMKESWMQSEVLICFNDISCEFEEDGYYVSKASATWNRWENIFGQLGYINDVQEYLEQKNHVGMLVAPKLLHGRYFGEDCIGESDMTLGKMFGISDYIQRSKYYADWSESFWIRTGIVDEEVGQKLVGALDKGVRMDDLVKLLPFICQKKKYFTEIIESTDYAPVYERTQTIYMREFWEMHMEDKTNHIANMDIWHIRRLAALKELNEFNIRNFIDRHEQVYVYGCGEIAELLYASKIINRICGFIVSDRNKESEIFYGYAVFRLSELDPGEGIGVVVALGDKNSEEVRNDVTDKFGKEHILFLKNGGRF